MAVAVPEFQSLLARLVVELGADIARLLTNSDRLDQRELLTYISAAYPELAAPYLQASGELTAQWYAEQPVVAPTSFVPQVADLAPVEQLAAQARWSMLQAKPVQTLQGKAGQMVFDESRRTVIDNTVRERVRWARHASANACGFCRMLATRGTVYRSESLARKSHSGCHCLAVPNRDGKYAPAPYVEQWRKDYQAARDGGATTPSQIANAMDKAGGSRRAKRPSAAGGSGTVPPVKPPTTGRPPIADGDGPFDGTPWGNASGAMHDLRGPQVTALEIYTLNATRINKAMRGEIEMSPELESQIRLIRSALAPGTAEFRVARGMRLSDLGEGLTDPRDAIGREFVDDAFMSVSGKRNPPPQTLRADDSVVVEILVSEGVRSRGVRQLAEFPLEEELIVIDGAPIYVVDASYDEQLKRWRLFGIMEAQ